MARIIAYAYLKGNSNVSTTHQLLETVADRVETGRFCSTNANGRLITLTEGIIPSGVAGSAFGATRYLVRTGLQVYVQAVADDTYIVGDRVYAVTSGDDVGKITTAIPAAGTSGFLVGVVLDATVYDNVKNGNTGEVYNAAVFIDLIPFAEVHTPAVEVFSKKTNIKIKDINNEFRT